MVRNNPGRTRDAKYRACSGVRIAQRLVNVLPDPAAPVFNHGSGVKFFIKKIDVSVLVYSTLLMQWTVKSLTKLIEPIQYWVVAS